MADTTNGRFDPGAPLKLLVALTLVAAAAAGVIVFLVAAGAVAPGGVPLVGANARRLLDGVTELTPAARLAVTVGAALVGVLALFELVRLVSPGTRPSALHVLTTDERGFVVVDSRGIAAVAAQAAQATRGVVEVRVDVKGNGVGPVRLVVSLGMYPGANIRRGGEEVRDSVRAAVERLVGVEIRDVVVSVHVLEPARLARLLE